MTPGIICLDKPEGLTSFAAVSRLRRITGIKKAGHAGTLDPMATGVLPVMTSGATRFIDFLESHEKGYTATVQLGVTTDTLDMTGAVLHSKKTSVEREELLNTLEAFNGVITQLPPMYSAVHVDGRRLYELARKGIEVERTPRQVEIFKLELIDFDFDTQSFSIDVLASKGTYIRSLANDIGEKLSCGASLSSLRRTKACGFSLHDAVTFEQLESFDDISKITLPVESALSHFPKVTVSSPQATRFTNGGGLDLQRLKLKNPRGIYRVFSPDNIFLGLGEADTENGIMTVKKILVQN